MKRFTNMLLAATVLAIPAAAFATGPNPNSLVVIPRIFNDCPTSTLSITDNHPSSLNITDSNLSCGGFANLHVWRFSEDGVNEALYPNASAFHCKFRLWTSGTAHGEAGLQIAPWWSEADGKFNCRTTDGEIACFGGRLPFYSFTASHGLHYVKGNTIHLEIKYDPNSLSQGDPGTIEYTVGYLAQTYQSGPLAFDQGNPAENHGTWGILNDARVGGHIQPFIQTTPSLLKASWTNICYEDLGTVPVESSTWGGIKSIYHR